MKSMEFTQRPNSIFPCSSAIDDEWQKTQCMPRETCVDVAKELGTTPNMFFKPPCVSVFRCSGCCNKEGVTCRNTSTTYVNKTVSPITLNTFSFRIRTGIIMLLDKQKAIQQKEEEMSLAVQDKKCNIPVVFN